MTNENNATSPGPFGGGPVQPFGTGSPLSPPIQTGSFFGSLMSPRSPGSSVSGALF